MARRDRFQTEGYGPNCATCMPQLRIGGNDWHLGLNVTATICSIFSHVHTEHFGVQIVGLGKTCFPAPGAVPERWATPLAR